MLTIEKIAEAKKKDMIYESFARITIPNESVEKDIVLWNGSWKLANLHANRNNWSVKMLIILLKEHTMTSKDSNNVAKLKPLQDYIEFCIQKECAKEQDPFLLHILMLETCSLELLITRALSHFKFCHFKLSLSLVLSH